MSILHEMSRDLERSSGTENSSGKQELLSIARLNILLDGFENLSFAHLDMRTLAESREKSLLAHEVNPDLDHEADEILFIFDGDVARLAIITGMSAVRHVPHPSDPDWAGKGEIAYWSRYLEIQRVSPEDDGIFVVQSDGAEIPYERHVMFGRETIDLTPLRHYNPDMRIPIISKIDGVIKIYNVL